MKGVVLAGGFGTRLGALTRVLNKHLLPIYDRPMIHYPLECLARSGVEDVLVLTGGHNSALFPELLGDGRDLGLRRLAYAEQQRAGGIAYALGLAEEFAGGDDILLVLGDNILQHTLEYAVQDYRAQDHGARVLLTEVAHPEQYGIAELDKGQIVGIVEKPAEPRSRLAVIGVYFYDRRVFDIVRGLTPSGRNELEITDVNNDYLRRGELRHSMVAGWWMDAGEDIEQYLACCNRVAREGANHKPQRTGSSN